MTVGILMLHCGLGIRNTNTFYTFRCPSGNIDPKPGMSHYIPCLIAE